MIDYAISVIISMNLIKKATEREINSIISKSSWELNCKTSQKLNTNSLFEGIN